MQQPSFSYSSTSAAGTDFWNAFWKVSDCSWTSGTFWKEAPIVTISFPETRIYNKGLNQANNRAGRPQSCFQRIVVLTKQYAAAHYHGEITSLGSCIISKVSGGLAGTELTPWSRVLTETLTGPHLVKKLSVLYETRMFIIAFTSARHLFPSRARAIQSMPSHTKGPVQVRGCVKYFVTSLSFHLDELVASCPTPELEDHSLVG